MNKNRRKQISEIVNELENIKLKLSSVLYDEEDAYDNMPDNLKGSIRGEESEEAIDEMNEADGLLDDALDSLNEALEHLEEIY
ncbi:MAG: hypothetical protein ACLSX5_01625 [Lachnospiraceae bacterium]